MMHFKLNNKGMKDNTFYNYYSKDGDAYRHAVGVHASNNFHVIVKNTYVTNMQYHNCDREIQMGAVVSTDVDGDVNTLTNDWGDNYGSPAVYRDLGDGERTMGYSDLDGHFNNGVPCYVMNQDVTTLYNGE